METKTFALTEFKVEGDDSGAFEGLASAFGTIDSYGDTIDRGAYADTIPEFLTRGFLGWGHDWTDPIGYFTDAKETKDGLWVKGEFHSDSQAQVYRQRVKERAAAGKFMGMSIGFEPLDFEFRTVDDREVRALTRIKLHEVSLVTVPAERNSHVTSVKNAPDIYAELAELREAIAELLPLKSLLPASEPESKQTTDEVWLERSRRMQAFIGKGVR